MSVLNKEGEKGRLPRLSEVLFESSNRSFGSLVALPSNVEAIEAGLQFATRSNPLVVITGPSGWGKTHLLDAVCAKLSHDMAMPQERITASELVANPSRIDTAHPLILDDVQEVLGKSRPVLSLKVNLEHRVRASRPTILSFTLAKPYRELKRFLPNYREWTVSVMGEPASAERVLLINQMSTSEGLILSPSLVNVLANSMYGNGRTLSGALKRLRVTSNSWPDATATLRACGLLDPFFADNPDWDLKLRILKVAESQRHAFPKASVPDLALVTMLHIASLAESDVARCMDLTPADVYLRAAKFQQKAEETPVLKTYVRQLVQQVVESLQ